MNPNSANQWWSKWTVMVTPAKIVSRNDPTVRTNATRFFRKAFGSTTQCRFTKLSSGDWQFEVRTEGHPTHDPSYVAYMSQTFTQFFTIGFGLGTVVRIEAHLEAGSAQDGTPASQLLILPSVIGE